MEQGVYLLDSSIGPLWRTYIDAEKLDISDMRRCVLGQLYGEYGRGLYQLGMTPGDGRKYGFDGSRRMTKTLTKEWRLALSA